MFRRYYSGGIINFINTFILVQDSSTKKAQSVMKTFIRPLAFQPLPVLLLAEQGISLEPAGTNEERA